MLLWIDFIICTASIVYSGIKLSRYGDIIAEKTGLGRAWIGLVLMASVTSVPELVTGVSSVTIARVPDIAVGDVRLRGTPSQRGSRKYLCEHSSCIVGMDRFI